MPYRYHILDVFTDAPLAGNPLAVVLDADSLDGARMQAIAREFNLSETVFVLEPRDPVNTARLRIFTPRAELPFAGHPTIGAAALIATLRAPTMLDDALQIVLEEPIGAVVCSVSRRRGGPLAAQFVLPRLPERLADLDDRAAIANALSLSTDEIGFGDHRPGVWSAGVAFAFVPVSTRAAIARAKPNAMRYEAAFGADVVGAFLYTTETEREDSDIHARMFAPTNDIPEDPATGSAAAAFAGVAVAFERPGNGAHTIVIEQGFEMGRPSVIRLGVEVADGALQSAWVQGGVVKVAEGSIDL